MQESLSAPARSSAPSGRDGSGNGRPSAELRPVDRSHLLRRHTRYPFQVEDEEVEAIRLRRERRVSAPFSAIPPLARRDP